MKPDDELLALFTVVSEIKKLSTMSGECKCPVCCGTIKWWKAPSNNHTSGKCSTADCINWIE